MNQGGSTSSASLVDVGVNTNRGYETFAGVKSVTKNDTTPSRNCHNNLIIIYLQKSSLAKFCKRALVFNI